MSHSVPSCHACGAIMFTKPEGCSNSDCPRSMTYQFRALRAAAQALVDMLRQPGMTPFAGPWVQQLAALEAALKEVGS